ncbi:unnamed protein product [Phaeothamnion confervicola]
MLHASFWLILSVPPRCSCCPSQKKAKGAKLSSIWRAEKDDTSCALISDSAWTAGIVYATRSSLLSMTCTASTLNKQRCEQWFLQRNAHAALLRKMLGTDLLLRGWRHLPETWAASCISRSAVFGAARSKRSPESCARSRTPAGSQAAPSCVALANGPLP